MIPLAEHNCGDSMLKCIDCNAQICSKCMVQCPVGNRCPNCTKRFTSHVLRVDVWVLLRCLIGGLIAGFLFGLLQVFIPFGGIYIWVFVYLFGTLAGNLLFKLIGRKLGGKVCIAITAGFLAGGFALSTAVTILVGLLLDQTGLANINNASAPVSTTMRKSNTSYTLGKSENMNINDLTKDPSETANDKSNTTNNKSTSLATKSYRDAALYSRLISLPSISLTSLIFLFGILSPFMGWNLPLPFFRRW